MCPFEEIWDIGYLVGKPNVLAWIHNGNVLLKFWFLTAGVVPEMKQAINSS